MLWCSTWPRMMGAQTLRCTPYRPVSNSQVERVHRTLNAMFAKSVKANQRDWHVQAKYICFAYNCSRHSGTTFSPYYLVYMRHPRVGIDMFLDRTEPAYQETDEYVEKTKSRMRSAHELVRKALKSRHDYNKKHYDNRVREARFYLHSFVQFYCPRLTAGRGRKFRNQTDGPYRIVRVLNEINFVIKKFQVDENKFATSTDSCAMMDRYRKSGKNTTKTRPRNWR